MTPHKFLPVVPLSTVVAPFRVGRSDPKEKSSSKATVLRTLPNYNYLEVIVTKFEGEKTHAKR